MTTQVKVLPRPGDGLRVRVVEFGRSRPAEGIDTFLTREYGEKTYHVHPGGLTEAIQIEKVPVDPPKV